LTEYVGRLYIDRVSRQRDRSSDFAPVFDKFKKNPARTSTSMGRASIAAGSGSKAPVLQIK
jgi:hypothetical protein